jgi:AAA+ superfamily predicted ATPase
MVHKAMNHNSLNQQADPLPDLRIEQVTRWMQEHWMARRPEYDWVTMSTANVCMDEEILEKFDDTVVLEEAYRYVSSHPIQQPRFPIVYDWYMEGILTQRTGSFVYHFSHPEKGPLEVLMVSFYISDSEHTTSIACMPRDFAPIWASFINACHRLRRPKRKVTVVGGNQRHYEPRVSWEDIILPEELKHDIMSDVEAFFRRGFEVYRKLNLNPFRKILLAGVPGTGKTMLCNALAKWGLERDFEVLYVSGSDPNGAHFFKIQQALAIAASAQRPTLILLEEIDAFLSEQQKSMILNVLDGVESFENEHGTMLVATTNYPESIDDRVLKRPGRLDRIYIVPPARSEAIADQMLKQYLGDMWKPEHHEMAQRLVDYPGAFIREVCVYALTQAVDSEDLEVPLELLRTSFDRLKNQIEARDKLMEQYPAASRKVGFASRNNSNGTKKEKAN